MSTLEQASAHHEDPLKGDVDKFVHPDETRTDEQIEFDRKYATEPYDHDASDEYWREYDEYHGTVNGGERPKTSITQASEGGDDSPMLVATPKGRKVYRHVGTIGKLRNEGLSNEEIGEHVDSEEDELEDRIKAANTKEQVGQGEHNDEDPYEETEDPLAGDVDRWVHPDETKD